jgi:hypothetical protein
MRRLHRSIAEFPQRSMLEIKLKMISDTWEGIGSMRGLGHFMRLRTTPRS